MGSLLNSTLNTRSIQHNSLKFIRSDLPKKLHEKEIQWLIQNNIITIIDLRSAEEIKLMPCSLATRSEFKYHIFSVTGGNSVPKLPSQVANSYIQMVDDKMWRIIDAIENSTTNVLYFCNAGKDRTGVVSALLLSRMNVSRETIIKDYMLSADNLIDMLKEYANQNHEIDIEVITPHKTYIESFLNFLELLPISYPSPLMPL